MFEKYLILADKVKKDVNVLMTGASEAEEDAVRQKNAKTSKAPKIVMGTIGAILLLTFIGLNFWLLSNS